MVEVDPSLVCVRAVALRVRGRVFGPVLGSKLTPWFQVERNRIWCEVDEFVRAPLRCTT